MLDAGPGVPFPVSDTPGYRDTRDTIPGIPGILRIPGIPGIPGFPEPMHLALRHKNRARIVDTLTRILTFQR